VRHPRISAQQFVVALVIIATVFAGASFASASSKPSTDLVASGARVITLSGSPFAGVGASTKTIVVTNASVIAKVRSLINALPVTISGSQMCPDDMLVPSTLSFKKTSSSTPFTKVVFQLGGCPSARVYQLGVAVSPTLGGPKLSSVYGQIKTLMDAAA
jgi:hypothetical protein